MRRGYGRGRPKKYEWNEAHSILVAFLAAEGVPQEVISNKIGCKPKTLRRLYKKELESSGEEFKAKFLEAFAARIFSKHDPSDRLIALTAQSRFGFNENVQINYTLPRISKSVDPEPEDETLAAEDVVTKSEVEDEH